MNDDELVSALLGQVILDPLGNILLDGNGWPVYRQPKPYCRVYWGSHGCDLGAGHTEPLDHICISGDENNNYFPQPCSTISPDGMIRYWEAESNAWGEPTPHLYIFGEDWNKKL